MGRRHSRKQEMVGKNQSPSSWFCPAVASSVISFWISNGQVVGPSGLRPLALTQTSVSSDILPFDTVYLASLNTNSKERTPAPIPTPQQPSPMAFSADGLYNRLRYFLAACRG
ncbi:hypothetical protein DdX_12984 [Ditylenchus destructor]|uniref:Uncharacterized protein n=1 Tax=Ditylenchus destructor TaxID=166010 RepID=A0AAD4QZY2_9BILA|nr:hypothetical protein DdX_12984 [Ditylenchus destructor]